MKRKILAVICLIMVFSMIFVSCSPKQPVNDDSAATGTNDNGGSQNGECTHTFSDAWSSDANNHWHRATCEHGEIKDGLAAHTDADENGKCDVCDYEIGHEHTYAETWTGDDTKHWRAASCSHTDEKIDEALHADDNKDYKCDVCEAHVHILNTATGYCDGCNTKLEEIDLSMESIINAIIASSNKVVSGKVDYNAIFRGITSDITRAHSVEFGLYIDGLYTKRTENLEDSSVWVNEVWRKLNGSDVTAISVEKLNGVLSKAEPSAADVDSLVGYYFAVSTLANGYGAENMISLLYELANPEATSLNKVSNYVETINAETRTVKFSYSILVINTDTAEGEDDGVDYYEVSVEFSYNEANVLTSLTIVCDCYGNSLDNEAENDYVYDQETKTITMKDTAKADTYTFVVTQTQGVQEAINMAPTKVYYPEEFSFAVNGAAVGTLVLSATFSEANPWPDVEIVCPTGTFIKFVKNDLVINVYEKGTEVDAKAKLQVFIQGDNLAVVPTGVAGEFTVVVTLGSFSASFDVTVEGAQGDQPTGEFSYTFTATDNNTFVDQEFTFTATESGKYTFYIPAGFGACDKAAWDNWGAPYVDPNMNGNGGQFTVEIAAGKTYTFLIMCPDKGVEHTFYYDFEACEVDSGDEGDDNQDPVAPGTLTGGNNNVSFSQAEIDANTADRVLNITTAGNYTFRGDLFVASIVDANGNVISRNADYTYTLAVGEYTVTFGMFSIFGIEADQAVALEIENTSAAGGDEGGEDVGGDTAEGSEENPIQITIPAENLAAEGDSINFTWYTFTTTEAGTITIVYSNANSWVRLINVNDAEDSNTGYQKGTLTFKVKANSTYKLGLGVWNPDEGVTASVSFEVVEESPLDNKGDFYSEDEKTFTVTDADLLAGGFVAIFNTADAGEYSFLSNYLMVSSVVAEDGTVISKNDNWNYELAAYSAYTITFSTGYISVAGEYAVTTEYQYPEGHQMNPYWIPWDYQYGNVLTAVYGGMWTPVWYSFYAEADGVITITSDSAVATLMVTGEIGSEISGVGSVTINVIKGRPYFVGSADFETFDENFVNLGSELNFVINFVEAEYVGDGTINMPNMIVLGENTASVPLYGCVWFAYKAEANGTLTVTTQNAVCAWYFNGQEYFATAGDKTIKMEEGDIVYLYVETSDWSAADIVFTASFKADPVSVWFESVVNTDGSAANEVNVADNTWVEISFQGAGQFVITWDNASAKVEIPETWASAGQILANGDVITGDAWFGVTLIVYFEDYAAGTVNLTITPYVAPAGDKALTVGDNTVVVQDTQMGDEYALPVNADKDVTYVVTVGANCVVLYDYTAHFEGETLEFTVPAGQTVTITVGAYSWSDNVAHVTVAEKVQGEVVEGDATTETLTFVVPTITSMFATTEIQTVSIAASGNYVISATGYDAILNTRLQYYDAASDSWVTIARAPGHEQHLIPYVIALSAGDTLQLRVQTWNSADAGTEIVVTIAPQA